MNKGFAYSFPIFTIVVKVLTSLIVIALIPAIIGGIVSVGCAGVIGATSCVGIGASSLPKTK